MALRATTLSEEGSQVFRAHWNAWLLLPFCRQLSPTGKERVQQVNPLEMQMMKYVLLAYRDEERWDAMSARERVHFDEACQASEQDLVRNHHLIDVKRLQNNIPLKVRMMHGQVSLADGPVAGSREQLIQILFIQARDLNAAIQIASNLPLAQAGHVEVRSIVE